MRRAAIVTGATLIGLAWIATYRTTPHAVALGGTPHDHPTASPSVTPSSSPTPTKSVSGTFTGIVVPNRYGDVQVRLVILNGRITDVQALVLPTDREESAYISSQAGPLLHDEVIQAQSARIDIVSGATYTSESYASSVESALKQANMG